MRHRLPALGQCIQLLVKQAVSLICLQRGGQRDHFVFDRSSLQHQLAQLLNQRLRPRTITGLRKLTQCLGHPLNSLPRTLRCVGNTPAVHLHRHAPKVKLLVLQGVLYVQRERMVGHGLRGLATDDLKRLSSVDKPHQTLRHQHQQGDTKADHKLLRHTEMPK
ncbi:hypothetical protein D3C71_1063850 [compost metagenome]